jgi:N6-adenosine-specific RNA methylase IME4
MENNLEKLSNTELEQRYRQNEESIEDLEREIRVVDGNLTCHCPECLAPPPPLSTPIRASTLTFNFTDFIDHFGQFDVVLMDPPWQLAGSQPTRGVALTYSQLCDRDIEAMPVQLLCQRGLIFLWTINNKFKFALSLLTKWGYRYAQDVIWVKRTVNRRLAKCHGYYLQHAKETCLVGVKGELPSHWNLGIGSDVIYTERRGQSQKPIELYEMIERLVPEGRFLEIFGRRHNLRDNWTTIGNEL